MKQLATVFLFICLIASNVMAQQGYIAGTVAIPEDNPIENVIVWVNESKVDTTDASGEYVLELLDPGQYTINFEHPDFVSASIRYIDVVESETTYVDYNGYIIGDINHNGTTNALDIVWATRYFKGESFIPPFMQYCSLDKPNYFIECEVNGDCKFNLVDMIYLTNYFKGVEGYTLNACSDCMFGYQSDSTNYNPLESNEFKLIFGNKDGSTIETSIGSTLEIPVWCVTPPSTSDTIAAIVIPLASDNFIIETRYTDDYSYFPDTLIDLYDTHNFLQPDYNTPENGWTSQSLFVGTILPTSLQYVISSDTVLFGTFVMKTQSDPGLLGQTVYPFNEGYDPRQFAGNMLGLYDGITEIHPTASYSSITFLDESELGNISGVVTDTEENLLEGVVVSLNDGPITDTTNAAGEYSFEYLVPGQYDIVFSYPEYDSAFFNNIEVTSSNTTIVNCELLPFGSSYGNISGVVTDQEENPLENVIVSLNDGFLTDTTNATGEYSFELLTPGQYNIVFSHPDYNDAFFYDIEATASDTTVLNCTLFLLGSENAYITGTITLHDETPLESAVVKALNTYLYDGTDSQGNYFLGPLVPGIYNLEIYHPSYGATVIPNVLATPQDTVRADFTAYRVGDINGDTKTNLSDIIYAVGYFRGDGDPPLVSFDCPPNGVFFMSGDVNADCKFNLSDIIYLVTYFKGDCSSLLACPDCPGF